MAATASRRVREICAHSSPNVVVSTDNKLSTLRLSMAAKNIQAFIVPAADAHLSEYVHPAYERRAFISGFTGSAGTAVVTADAALLWTDGRYFLQAEQELGPEWTLMKSGQPGVPTLEEWLATNLADGGRCGIDPFVHSVEEAGKLKQALEGAARNLSLTPLSGPNLVDDVWAVPPEGGMARPSLPNGPARQLDLSIAGVTCAEKVPDATRSSEPRAIYAHCVVADSLTANGDSLVPHAPYLRANFGA